MYPRMPLLKGSKEDGTISRLFHFTLSKGIDPPVLRY
jgi:hypothetical protein